MDLKTRFLNGMIAGGSGVAIKLCLNIILIPIIISKLGPQYFGLYTVLLTVSEILLMMDLGLTTGMVHQLSGPIAENKTDKVNRILTLGHMSYGLIALLILGYAFWGGNQLSTWLHLEHFQHLATFCIGMIFCETALNLYVFYFRAVLMSHALYQWTSSADILQNILNSLTAAVLLMTGFGLKSIVLARLFISLLMGIVLIVQTRRYHPEALFPLHRFDWRDLTSLAKVSVFFMIQQLCSILTFRMDNLILSSRLTMLHVAAYAFVTKVFGQVPYLISKFCEGLLPIYLKIDKPDDPERSQFFFLRMSSLVHTLACMMIILLAANYRLIFDVLSKDKLDFQLTLIPILPLCLLIWSGAVVTPATQFLISRSNFKLQTTLSVSTALINFALSWVLVSQIGLVGVVLGSLVPHFLEHQLLLIPRARKALQISLKQYFETVYLRNLPTLGVVILLIWTAHTWLNTLYNHNLILLMVSVLASFIGSYIWFYTSASQQEQGLILKVFSQGFNACRASRSLFQPITLQKRFLKR